MSVSILQFKVFSLVNLSHRLEIASVNKPIHIVLVELLACLHVTVPVLDQVEKCSLLCLVQTNHLALQFVEIILLALPALVLSLCEVVESFDHILEILAVGINIFQDLGVEELLVFELGNFMLGIHCYVLKRVVIDTAHFLEEICLHVLASCWLWILYSLCHVKGQR